MEELWGLRRYIEAGDYDAALALLDEMEAMSRDDKITSATSRSFCLVVITQFDARPSQTEVKNFSDDFNVTMH